MPLSHAVESQFAVFLGRGVVTGAELRSGLAAVITMSRAVERPMLLFDFRDVGRLDLRPEDLDDLCRIVERAGPAAKGARFALVAEADAVVGAARRFEEVAVAAGLPIEVKVFREIDAARCWLAYV